MLVSNVCACRADEDSGGRKDTDEEGIGDGRRAKLSPTQPFHHNKEDVVTAVIPVCPPRPRTSSSAPSLTHLRPGNSSPSSSSRVEHPRSTSPSKLHGKPGGVGRVPPPRPNPPRLIAPLIPSPHSYSVSVPSSNHTESHAVTEVQAPASPVPFFIADGPTPIPPERPKRAVKIRKAEEGAAAHENNVPSRSEAAKLAPREGDEAQALPQRPTCPPRPSRT